MTAALIARYRAKYHAKKAEFHPVVFHIIRTTASAGAVPKQEWRMSAALHEVMVKMRFSFVQGAA